MENVMPTAAIDDPILKRFRAALDEMYGDRIERVVLFGSRTREDAWRIRITTWRCSLKT
jgi:predicted nucleotidyltransferase